VLRSGRSRLSLLYVEAYGNLSAARAAVEVLSDAGHSMTFDELRLGVSQRLGRPVKSHSLRAAVYYHLRGRNAWFERPGRGRYTLSPAGMAVAES
jgi:hypothetical protein